MGNNNSVNFVINNNSYNSCCNNNHQHHKGANFYENKQKTNNANEDTFYNGYKSEADDVQGKKQNIDPSVEKYFDNTISSTNSSELVQTDTRKTYNNTSSCSNQKKELKIELKLENTHSSTHTKEQSGRDEQKITTKYDIPPGGRNPKKYICDQGSFQNEDQQRSDKFTKITLKEFQNIMRNQNIFQLHDALRKITKLWPCIDLRDVMTTFGLFDFSRRTDNGEILADEIRYQYEWARIMSFERYTGNGNVFVLARNGFFFEATAVGDVTRCNFCQVMYEIWQSGDNVRAIHSQISPTCPFVAASAPNDVSIAGENSRRQRSSRVHSNQQHGDAGQPTGHLENFPIDGLNDYRRSGNPFDPALPQWGRINNIQHEPNRDRGVFGSPDTDMSRDLARLYAEQRPMLVRSNEERNTGESEIHLHEYATLDGRRDRHIGSHSNSRTGTDANGTPHRRRNQQGAVKTVYGDVGTQKHYVVDGPVNPIDAPTLPSDGDEINGWQSNTTTGTDVPRTFHRRRNKQHGDRHIGLHSNSKPGTDANGTPHRRRNQQGGDKLIGLHSNSRTGTDANGTPHTRGNQQAINTVCGDVGTQSHLVVVGPVNPIDAPTLPSDGDGLNGWQSNSTTGTDVPRTFRSRRNQEYERPTVNLDDDPCGKDSETPPETVTNEGSKSSDAQATGFNMVGRRRSRQRERALPHRRHQDMADEKHGDRESDSVVCLHRKPKHTCPDCRKKPP